jgi:hypothetical protein
MLYTETFARLCLEPVHQPRLRGRVGWLLPSLGIMVLGSGSAEPSSTRRARGLVNPIVLNHSTGRGSKGEALLV